MIRIKYHMPGTGPGTLEYPDAPEAKPAVLTLIRYDETSYFEERFETFGELVGHIEPNQVNWVNIGGLGDLDAIRAAGERFGLHPLALEDALNTAQRPKVELYTDHYFVVSEMVYNDGEQRLALEQVSLFVGNHFLVTIQEESEHDVFDRIRERLRSGRGFLRARGCDYLAYALLDGIVDQFFPLLEDVGDEIEEIETELLNKPTRDSLHRLHDAKRVLLQLRRASWPQREILSTLMRDDTGIVCDGTKVFLRDCYDHTIQIIDIIESYRDLSAGLMDLYLSSLGVRTNEIMRVLTIVSTFFIPLTFLAGVYGMNFDTSSPFNMPELKLEFGYVFFWVACLLITCVTFYVVKKKRWL